MNKRYTLCHHAARPEIDPGLLTEAVFFNGLFRNQALLTRNILKILINNLEAPATLCGTKRHSDGMER